jgi:hypothetical protein
VHDEHDEAARDGACGCDLRGGFHGMHYNLYKSGSLIGGELRSLKSPCSSWPSAWRTIPMY